LYETRLWRFSLVLTKQQQDLQPVVRPSLPEAKPVAHGVMSAPFAPALHLDLNIE
jgi:hypothetical protein